MGYSHSDIGHNWAHQLKQRMTDRTFSFEGGKIYSYSTVIGQIVEVNNQQIYLLNTGSASNSTSKHQSYAFRAIPNDAIQFSVSCGNFIWNWRGFGYWNGEFDKKEQIRLVKKYITEVYALIFAFKDSTTISDERNFSLKWYDEAQRFCEITKCTTLKKLYKEWNAASIQQLFQGIKDGAAYRRMLNALNKGERNMAALIDITLGKGTYQAYKERTKGARSAQNTRDINRRLGFVSNNSHYHLYYEPYKILYLDKQEYKILHRNRTFIEYSAYGHVEGGWNHKIIEKYRKEGVLIKKMCETRRENLIKNLEIEEAKWRKNRMKEAKKRLEKYIGLTGWEKSCYGYTHHGFKSFDYNGTVWEFGDWEHSRELSAEEYKAFGLMNSEEKRVFIHDKRDWMLTTLQAELREREECKRRYAEQRAEWQREAEEKARLMEEKKAYIEEKKAKGDSGLIQLFHEGLIDGDGFYGKGATFFHGGNALLRVNERRQCVETSKGIYVSFAECKRLWLVVSHWHNNGTTFTSSDEKVHATTNDWSISRFQDDIMVAGCHAIHYSEMELAARQLGLTA